MAALLGYQITKQLLQSSADLKWFDLIISCDIPISTSGGKQFKMSSFRLLFLTLCYFCIPSQIYYIIFKNKIMEYLMATII